jgi:hypothetical protein
MITRRTLLGGGLGALALGVAGCSEPANSNQQQQKQQQQQEPSTDKFGIKKLYHSIEGGMFWQAAWEGGRWDDDPWLERGSDDIRYRVSNGILTVTGATSRLYVRDPKKKRQWRNVEVTVYGMRVSDDDVAYSGLVTDVRTNHGTVGQLAKNPGDSRGLVARLRFDGQADFGKEIKHPNTVATKPVRVFKGEMPRNKWIGYKHICRDLPGHRGTHQELWMDLTGGENGGDWKQVAYHDDRGHSLGEGEKPAVKGVDPAAPLTSGPRKGSESGLPNIAVLFRADDLGRNGLKYKWASVREIV